MLQQHTYYARQRFSSLCILSQRRRRALLLPLPSSSLPSTSSSTSSYSFFFSTDASSSATSSSSSRSAGLVGMPNVGKSTLFNAFVKQQLAQASNYPFCTIEPNVALVEIPDPRLHALGKLENSQSIKPQRMTFHDIAGLIAGASKGEGLGNAFLGNIRAVSVILHVIRCYDDPDVIHVLETPDPVRDLNIIENELQLADLQSIEKRLTGGAAARKAKTPEAIAQVRMLTELQPLLESGYPARFCANKIVKRGEELAWHRLHLLTQKPMLYICNVNEDDVAKGNDMTRALKAEVESRERKAAAELGSGGGGGAEGMTISTTSAPGTTTTTNTSATSSSSSSLVSTVCAKLESEAGALENDEERKEFLQAYGLSETSLDSIVRSTASMLRLQTYYTVGPQEARAWSIPMGATAPQAAGVIHTDFEKNFIRAEIVSYDECIKYGGEAAARKAGIGRNEGKDYVMKDGDVAFFKFGGGGSGR